MKKKPNGNAMPSRTEKLCRWNDYIKMHTNLKSELECAVCLYVCVYAIRFQFISISHWIHGKIEHLMNGMGRDRDRDPDRALNVYSC